MFLTTLSDLGTITGGRVPGTDNITKLLSALCFFFPLVTLKSP